MRNKLQIQMSESAASGGFAVGISAFGFVSDFVLRISDLLN
jgi:hypothetical protein